MSKNTIFFCAIFFIIVKFVCKSEVICPYKIDVSLITTYHVNNCEKKDKNFVSNITSLQLWPIRENFFVSSIVLGKQKKKV
jgi:hypothetical protein